MLNAVTAYWGLGPDNQTDWATLEDPNQNGSLGIVVLDQSIRDFIDQDAAGLAFMQQTLPQIPGVILGYVFSRTASTDYADLRTPADVQNDVDRWYAVPDSNGAPQPILDGYLDGLYFDNAVMPGDALDQQRYGSSSQTARDYWTALLPQVRNAHPAARTHLPAGQAQLPASQIMLLAGASPNKWLLTLADFLLMWETDPAAYYKDFCAYGQVLRDNQGTPTGSNVAYAPRWWKDPANTSKLVHTVNNVGPNNPDGYTDYQQAVTYLAFTERNAGQLWQTDGYGHLPTYWQTEVGEATFLSNNASAALDDEHLMRAAHRVGVNVEGALTAWPNFEAAWYPDGQHRGTIFVSNALNGNGVSFQDVPLTELEQFAWGDLCGDTVALYDVAGLWAAAHRWARDKGLETAIPTFEAADYGQGTVCGVIKLDTGLPWLHADFMPTGDAYQAQEQPPTGPPRFSEAGAVVRNVGRWVTDNATGGAARWGRPVSTGWPCFDVPLAQEPVSQAQLPADPEGRANGQYAVYMVDAAQTGIYWKDVLADEYLQQL